jgi:hypothetical protein
MPQKTFVEILEAAEELPQEDRESLIDILQKRLRDRRRSQIFEDIRAAGQEFMEGKCQAVTPEQLMEKILS